MKNNKKLEDYNNELMKYIKSKKQLFLEDLSHLFFVYDEGALEEFLSINSIKLMDHLKQFEIHSFQGEAHRNCPLHIVEAKKEISNCKTEITEDGIKITGEFAIFINLQIGEPTKHGQID